jgi:hypothetical protein
MRANKINHPDQPLPKAKQSKNNLQDKSNPAPGPTIHDIINH